MNQKGKLSYKRSFGMVILTFSLVTLFQNCGSQFETPEVPAATVSESEDPSTNTPSTPPTPPPPQCAANMHLENNVCTNNKRSCPMTNGTAEETWNGTTYGPCTVVTCSSGYRNQANACVFSPTSCPITNGNGQTQSNGTCQVVSCNTNYHISGNTCASNIQLCSVANGAGQSVWNGTMFGPCTVISCNSGYVSMGNTCVANTPTGSSSWMPRNVSRFFISGHSLTDDPLASYIVDIATKRSDTVNYNQQIILGSPIRSRTRDSSTTAWPGYSMGKNRNGSFGLNVISEFRNPQTIGAGQRYDTLVITENHNLPLNIQWENTIGFLRHYHDRLIEGNASGRTFFYNSWLDIDKNNPTNWIDYEKKALVAWECTTSKVNHTLQAAGRNDRTLNLPVGAALVDLVERAIANQVAGITGNTSQKMNMIFSDNVHLTSLGVYYAALITYSSIYGKTGSGVTPPSGVNATTAAALQTLAWNYVNAYYNRNNPGLRDMAECRSYVAQQVCPAYWILKQDTGQTNNCQNFFSNANSSPFRWPDSSFVALPAPP